MKRGKKAKDFLQIGKIVGDRQTMQEFIDANLRYPEKARAKKVQGTVYVAYSVNDDGKVANARVVRGIGSGCDEEALRLVRMLRFQRVKNRKVKVLANREIGIKFIIDQPNDNAAGAQNSGGSTLSYSYVVSTPAPTDTAPQSDTTRSVSSSGSFSYTVQIAPDSSGHIIPGSPPREDDK